MSAVSVYATYATGRGTRNRFSAISENSEPLFFFSTQNDDTLPLWINYRRLSISAPSRCPPPILAFSAAG